MIWQECTSNLKWGVNGSGTLGEAVSQDVINKLTAVNTKSDTEKLEVIKKYAKLSNPVEQLQRVTYTADAGWLSDQGLHDFSR